MKTKTLYDANKLSDRDDLSHAALCGNSYVYRAVNSHRELLEIINLLLDHTTGVHQGTLERIADVIAKAKGVPA